MTVEPAEPRNSDAAAAETECFGFSAGLSRAGFPLSISSADAAQANAVLSAAVEAPVAEDDRSKPPQSAPAKPADPGATAPGADQNTAEMAFAARLQTEGQNSVPRAQSSVPFALHPAVAGPAERTKTDTEEPAGDSIPSPAAALHAVGAFQSRPEFVTDAGPQLTSKPPAAHDAGSSPIEAPPPVTAPQPSHSSTPVLKDISLQVSQSGEERVQVRVVQQSGELHVAVRTADSALAQGLQQGLPDLVSRLQDHGFKAETWRPPAAVPAAAGTADAQNSSKHSGDSHSQSGGDWSRQGGQPNRQPNQNPNRPNPPRWVEELQSSFGASLEHSGESHGNSY